MVRLSTSFIYSVLNPNENMTIRRAQVAQDQPTKHPLVNRVPRSGFTRRVRSIPRFGIRLTD